MARPSASKNYWILLVFILIGIVLGGFIGQLFQNVPALAWLGYGKTFGLTSPVTLDLGIIVLTFGISFNITIAGIIGVVLAFVIFHLIFR